jgi:hypothetical protein
MIEVLLSITVVAMFPMFLIGFVVFWDDEGDYLGI